MKVILIMVLVAGPLMGCAASSSSNRLADPWTLQHELPVGTDEPTAAKLLTSQGFTCKKVVDGSFIARTNDASGREQAEAFKNVNYLECHRKEGGGWMSGSVTTGWGVYVILDDDSKVSRVVVTRVLTGP